jgi:hypothetical protein
MSAFLGIALPLAGAVGFVVLVYLLINGGLDHDAWVARISKDNPMETSWPPPTGGA